MPLVMPPVATGLILLLLCAPRGPLCRMLQVAGIEVVFTWKAVVLAMSVMALPLFVRTVRAGIEQVDRRYEAAAATLGAPPLRVFLTITLPLALPSVLAGTMLGFARAIGEFGATIVIAGSIPGATRTLAVAIYSFTETGRDREAALLIGVSAAIAFVALWFSNRLIASFRIRRQAVIQLDFTLSQAGFSLELHERLSGSITALFGPSGAGKTTTLEALAGLRRPASGTIAVGDRVLFSSTRGVDLPVHQRHVGYVAQDVSLFPHLSVRRNVLYGRRPGQRLELATVAAMLEIEPLLDRGATQLSGGERQRVALARALMSSADVLLLDEPLAAVDLELRRRILPYLERVRDELRIPIIYVTHSPDEVHAIADAVIVMDNGRVVKSGPPRQVLWG